MTLVDARGNIIISAETKAAEKALTELAKTTRDVAKAQREAEVRSQALTAAANKMGTALLTAAAAGAALLGKSIQLAARTETLGVVVNQLGKTAGYTSGQMDKFTKGVVDQGITLRHARNAIAMMAQANVDLAQASDLARLAQDAAVIANLNSSETFQRLIQVIQTGNIRMARHLGLVVDFQKAYMDFADANNTTTKQLTQTEKVQIRVSEVMRAGAAITGTYEAAMETAGKKVLSLQRHLEESSRLIGEQWLPAFADAVDVATAFLESIENLDEGQLASLSTTIAMTTGFLALGGAILKLRGPMIALQAWIAKVGMTTAVATGGITLLLGVIAAFITSEAAATAAAEANTEAVMALAEAAVLEGHSLEYVNKLIREEAEARGMSTIAGEEWNETFMMGVVATEKLQSNIIEMTAAELKQIVAAEAAEEQSKRVAEALRDRSLAEAISTQASRDAQAAYMDMGPSLDSYTRAAIASKVAQGILNKALEEGVGITDEERSTLEKLYTAMGKPPTEVGALVDIFNDLAGGVEPIEIALDGVYKTIEEMATPVDSLSQGLIKAKEDAGLVAAAADDQTAWNSAVDYADEFGGRIWDAYRIILKLKRELANMPDIVTGGGGGGGGGGDSTADESKFGLHGGGALTGVNLLGERGQELVINGVVIPNALTNKLLALGLAPNTRFGLGGAIGAGYVADAGGGGGITYDPETYPNDERGIKPSEREAYRAAQAAATTTEIVAVRTAVAKVVEPALAAVATAMPNSQEIAAGIQEAQLSQVQAQMRQNAEMLSELKIQTEILAQQGTSDDTARAVKDSLQGII